MRIHLLTNKMLNGTSLQMCLDYWHPFNQHHPNRLEWHIKQLCHYYQVTFEELFSRLSMVRAYDSSIRCKTCGKLYELCNPCDLPDPNYFLDWQCAQCLAFINRGVVDLQKFLASVEPDNEIPF